MNGQNSDRSTDHQINRCAFLALLDRSPQRLQSSLPLLALKPLVLRTLRRPRGFPLLAWNRHGLNERLQSIQRILSISFLRPVLLRLDGDDAVLRDAVILQLQ